MDVREGAQPKKRLNIGMLLGHIEHDFDAEVCRGAVLAAKSIDANLIIFPGRYRSDLKRDRLEPSDKQYNTVFSYARDGGLDALIVSIGTLGTFMSEEEKENFVNVFGDLPILTLSEKIGNRPCVTFDPESGLADVIDHLVREHGRQRIAYIGGPETNEEAAQRYKIYRESLKTYGLEFNEDWVMHGDFSRHEPGIDGFLQRISMDIDAVVCANDEMALRAMRTLEKMGIGVGEDIVVTGYDDSPIVIMASPNLTTVSARPSYLGYYGVMGCANLAEGRAPSSRKLTTKAIYRTSCGCLYSRIVSSALRPGASPASTAAELAEYAFGELIGCPVIFDKVNRFKALCEQLIAEASDDSITEFSNDALLERLDNLLDGDSCMPIPDMELNEILQTVIDTARRLISSESKQLKLYELMVMASKILNIYTLQSCFSVGEDVRMTIYHAGGISVKENGDVDKFCRDTVMRLGEMKIRNSMFYLFDKPKINDSDIWQPPEYLRLKAAQIGDKVVVPDASEQRMHRTLIFDNKYMSDDRKTFVVSPLYFENEHYGLLLCDIEYELFFYMYAVSRQISMSFRLINLLGELGERLEQINSANNMLDRQSKTDELTGIQNRRGFFMNSERIISVPQNDGKRAMLVFADLNSLKHINDTFGHEEGDFALRTAADILCYAMDGKGVVGRVGGDEFAALTIISEENDSDRFRERLEVYTALRNQQLCKPYPIELSIGTVEFECGDGSDINHLMTVADGLQYADKQKKKSCQ